MKTSDGNGSRRNGAEQKPRKRITPDERVSGGGRFVLDRTALKSIAAAAIDPKATPMVRRAAQAIRALAESAEAAVLGATGYATEQRAAHRDRFVGAERALRGSAAHRRQLLKEWVLTGRSCMAEQKDFALADAVKFVTRAVRSDDPELGRKLIDPFARVQLARLLSEEEPKRREVLFARLCFVLGIKATGANLRRKPASSIYPPKQLVQRLLGKKGSRRKKDDDA